MQKLDLNNFFIQNEKNESFKLLQENDGKQSNQNNSLPPNAQKLFVRKEKKGRGGKTVTIVEGYQGNPQTLEQLCKKVKQQCGVGGSVSQKRFIMSAEKDVYKIKLLYSGLRNAMSVIVRKEGFFALYKGLVPTLVGIAPYAALNFATYDLVKMHYYRRGAASHNGPGKGGSAPLKEDPLVNLVLGGS